MSVVLLPSWILSGAMFPASGAAGWLRWVMAVNPVTYAVTATRRALHGGVIPDGAGVPWSSLPLELGVTAAVAVAGLAMATWICSRRA